jgi:hypothetical protein
MADPARELADGEISSLLLLMICHSDLINSLFHGAQTQAEIDWLVACLFDKRPPTPQPATVPEPFSSENPPVVTIPFFFDILYLHG